MNRILLVLAVLLTACHAPQSPKLVLNDSNTPLHLMKPDYSMPYEVPSKESIRGKLDKILTFLEENTPAKVIDTLTNEEITDFKVNHPGARMHPGAFRLTSYEWGVTYSAMLKATEATGDKKFANYTIERLTLLANSANMFENMYNQGDIDPQMKKVVHPKALDDAGAICASMIRCVDAGANVDIRSRIEVYIDFIMNREYRLKDGNFARNRPQHNTVWLDDMYMALPAIAEMGQYMGDKSYFEEALKQIGLFREKMWVPEKQLFRHGWVEAMNPHPSFHWGRANGWAILTLTDVLDAIPENYPGRDNVLALYKEHIQGLSRLQSSTGLWHQLLDRNDTYLESSATAIYAYCMAHGINKGWLNPMAYGPQVILAWNGLTKLITDNGEVDGTCVGTGMGFDPAYYAFRPVHKYAAHGYGPVILAGSEIIEMLDRFHPRMNDNAVQFYDEEIDSDLPIFDLNNPSHFFD